MEEEKNISRKTLHLNLKKKWFEMIFIGVKTEEYRELTPYWIKRILCDIGRTCQFFDEKYKLKEGRDIPKAYFKPFDTITFSNGYDTYRPQFEIELKGIEIREGNPEWGAEPGKKYFVLKLGEILGDVNCARFIIENIE